MNIGEYLMRARKRKGLSQEEVANTLNVSRQSVSLWECDQTVPSLDNLVAISKLYDTSIDVLTGQKEYEDSNKTNDDIYNDDLYQIEVEKSYKRFMILAMSFTIASGLLFVVPVISTMVTIAAIVFSILSMRRKRTNYNLFTLIFGIVFFLCSIFVYININTIYDVSLI